MDVGALIYAAAYHGQIRQLKKLLAQCGPSTNYLSWRHPHGGAMAIYVACEFDHYDAVKMLLNAGAPVDAARDDGATPLYLACRDGKLDIVSLLLERGADVNRVDGNQMNALWVACHQGRTDLAKILLEARADPLHRVEGWSPVMLAERLAREQGRYDLMDALEPFLPGGARATAPSAAGSSSAAASAASASSSSSAGQLSPPEGGGGEPSARAARCHARRVRLDGVATPCGGDAASLLLLGGAGGGAETAFLAEGRGHRSRLALAPRITLSDLDDAVLGLLLSSLSARSLARVAQCSRSMRELHVPEAALQRAQLLGLPPDAAMRDPSRRSSSSSAAALRSLRFLDLVAGRPRHTLAAGALYSMAVLMPTCFDAHAWGGGVLLQADADDADADDEPKSHLAHLALDCFWDPSMEAAHRTGVPRPTKCWGSDADGFYERSLSEVEVSAGLTHSLMLMQDGAVWASGMGPALGLGEGAHDEAGYDWTKSFGEWEWRRVAALAGQHVVQVAASANRSFFLTADGAVWHCGSTGADFDEPGKFVAASSVPRRVSGLDGVRVWQVAAGYAHVLAIDEGGAPWGWGRNREMQLGTFAAEAVHQTQRAPLRIPLFDVERRRVRLRAIGAGCYHSLAVCAERGALWAWGMGAAVGHGSVTPAIVEWHPHGERTTRRGAVAAVPLLDVCAVAAGWHHSVVLTKLGHVLTFGLGTDGQLGHGDFADQRTPKRVAKLGGVAVEVAAGHSHTLVRLEKRLAMLAFGRNSLNQLGTGTPHQTGLATPTEIRCCTCNEGHGPPQEGATARRPWARIANTAELAAEGLTDADLPAPCQYCADHRQNPWDW